MKSNRKSAWFVIVPVVLNLCIFVASSTQAAGNIYYVATNGSDSYSCSQAQDISTPKRNIMTPEGGIACIQGPGDKLLIRGGTYDETISNYSLYNGSSPSWPPGTSWDNAITVAAYDGEITKVNEFVLGDCCANPALPDLRYWIFDGIHTGPIFTAGHVDHVRFINLDVNGGKQNGIMCVSGGSNFMEFINTEVYDCGDPATIADGGGGATAPDGTYYSYGFYYVGNDVLFDHMKVHDIVGYGFHIYSPCDSDIQACPNRNTIRYSEIYNTGTRQGSSAILFTYGDGFEAYGNIIHDNRGGIDVGYGASNTKVYNNTIYSNTDSGISTGGGWSSRPNVNTIIANNIVANNGGYGIFNSNGGSPQPEPQGTLIMNNLLFNNAFGPFYETGTDTTNTNNIQSDPKFVNASGNDFRLTSGSPAIAAGVDVGLSFNGSAPDIGACETDGCLYVEGGYNPLPR